MYAEASMTHFYANEVKHDKDEVLKPCDHPNMIVYDNVQIQLR